MKLHDLWKQSNTLIAIVPLAIDDYGFIYINDIGVINITINEKHRSMHQHQITTAQLKQLITNARCDQKQQNNITNYQNQLLNPLQAYDDEFIFHF